MRSFLSGCKMELGELQIVLNDIERLDPGKNYGLAASELKNTSPVPVRVERFQSNEDNAQESFFLWVPYRTILYHLKKSI